MSGLIKELLQSTDWQLLVIDRLSYAGDLSRIDEVVSEVGDSAKSRVEFIYHDLFFKLRYVLFFMPKWNVKSFTWLIR